MCHLEWSTNINCISTKMVRRLVLPPKCAYPPGFLATASHCNQQDDILAMARGVPVLFVHGNAGSYKQVRSFGAVASRARQSFAFEGLRTTTPSELKQQAAQLKINQFDFFSVDLDEELSAFSGDVLRDQTEYVHDCIKFILNTYKQRNVPNPVSSISSPLGPV